MKFLETGGLSSNAFGGAATRRSCLFVRATFSFVKTMFMYIGGFVL